MAIQLVVNFKCSVETLWSIVGTPDRVDWVPGVTGCDFDGEVRSLELPGAGAIRERILKRDEDEHRLEYSCIEAPMALDTHLASISLTETDEGCQMTWETKVAPEAYEPFIRDSMEGAVKQLHELLA